MDNKIDKTSEKQNKGNPNWEKGMESPNPDGRPKGTKNYLTLLEDAIRKYEIEKGKALFDRLIERAFISDNVLLGVIKKFIPDKQNIQIEEIEPIKLIVEHVGSKNKSN